MLLQKKEFHMSQALQSPYAVPVLQMVAGIAVSQIITGTNPLTKLVADKLTELSVEFLDAARKVIFDSPVIALTAGLTYLVQEFATPQVPSLSLSMPGCTPLKSAMYVAGIFAVRSALSLYLERVINNAVLIDLKMLTFNIDKDWKKIQKTLENTAKERSDDTQIVGYLRNAVIRNAVPIAVACTAAYYAEIPVKLAQTALYTAALIPVVKLLGKGLGLFGKGLEKGYEIFMSVEIVKNTADKVNGWIT
jgi:hypothetical protein